MTRADTSAALEDLPNLQVHKSYEVTEERVESAARGLRSLLGMLREGGCSRSGDTQETTPRQRGKAPDLAMSLALAAVPRRRAASGPWICDVCSLENPWLNSVCEVCLSPRPRTGKGTMGAATDRNLEFAIEQQRQALGSIRPRPRAAQTTSSKRFAKGNSTTSAREQIRPTSKEATRGSPRPAHRPPGLGEPDPARHRHRAGQDASSQKRDSSVLSSSDTQPKRSNSRQKDVRSRTIVMDKGEAEGEEEETGMVEEEQSPAAGIPENKSAEQALMVPQSLVRRSMAGKLVRHSFPKKNTREQVWRYGFVLSQWSPRSPWHTVMFQNGELLWSCLDLSSKGRRWGPVIRSAATYVEIFEERLRESSSAAWALLQRWKQDSAQQHSTRAGLPASGQLANTRLQDGDADGDRANLGDTEEDEEFGISACVEPPAEWTHPEWIDSLNPTPVRSSSSSGLPPRKRRRKSGKNVILLELESGGFYAVRSEDQVPFLRASKEAAESAQSAKPRGSKNEQKNEKDLAAATDQWVCCDRCNKWRRLRSRKSLSSLAQWFCEQNDDPDFNSCDMGQEVVSSEEESDDSAGEPNTTEADPQIDNAALSTFMQVIEETYKLCKTDQGVSATALMSKVAAARLRLPPHLRNKMFGDLAEPPGTLEELGAKLRRSMFYCRRTTPIFSTPGMGGQVPGRFVQPAPRVVGPGGPVLPGVLQPQPSLPLAPGHIGGAGTARIETPAAHRALSGVDTAIGDANTGMEGFWDKSSTAASVQGGGAQSRLATSPVERDVVATTATPTTGGEVALMDGKPAGLSMRQPPEMLRRVDPRPSYSFENRFSATSIADVAAPSLRSNPLATEYHPPAVTYPEPYPQGYPLAFAGSGRPLPVAHRAAHGLAHHGGIPTLHTVPHLGIRHHPLFVGRGFPVSGAARLQRSQHATHASMDPTMQSQVQPQPQQPTGVRGPISRIQFSQMSQSYIW